MYGATVAPGSNDSSPPNVSLSPGMTLVNNSSSSSDLLSGMHVALPVDVQR